MNSKVWNYYAYNNNTIHETYLYKCLRIDAISVNVTRIKSRTTILHSLDEPYTRPQKGSNSIKVIIIVSLLIIVICLRPGFSINFIRQITWVIQ